MGSRAESTKRFCASVLKYHVMLRRKPFFFVFNIILPIIMLSVSTMSVFWLPADCDSKTGLAMNIFLAFIVFHTVISELIPRTNNMPLLCTYIKVKVKVNRE
jgi:nicotinic acetylcholine receptor